MTKLLDNKILVQMILGNPESFVIEQLGTTGVSADEAHDMYLGVSKACAQGVQAVFTDGLSAPDGPPTDPLLAEAFRFGQSSFRQQIRIVWLQWFIKLVLIIAVIAGLIWFVYDLIVSSKNVP